VMLMVGIAIGLALPYLGTPQNAIGQQHKQVKWEYHVEHLPGNDAAYNKKTINNLAKDGWEFAGHVSGTSVAFKREKQ